MANEPRRRANDCQAIARPREPVLVSYRLDRPSHGKGTLMFALGLRNLSRRLSVASFISFAAIGALTACGTARVIQRNQVGGVIELQGDRGKAMEQANQEMAAH